MLHFLSLQQIEFSYTVFGSCAHAALHCPFIYVYFEFCSFRASASVSIRPDYQPAAQPTAAGYAASCPAISRVHLQLALQPTGIPAEEWIAIRFAYLFVPDGPLRMKWSLQAVVQREGRSCCRFFNEHSFARAPAWSRSGRSGVDSLTFRSLVQSFDVW